MHPRDTELPMELAEDYCLWEGTEEGFHVGVVGCGPGFMTLLSIMAFEEYQEFIPPMRLTAVCGPLENARKRAYIESTETPVYPDWPAMLRAHPEINLLVELVGKRLHVRSIRQGLPEEVSLVDHNASVFLCGMHTALLSGRHVRMNLDSQKALLQAIIDEVREDILVLDTTGKVVDMNRTVREKTRQERNELLGKACWHVEQDSDGKPFCAGANEECPFHESLRTGKTAEAMLTRVDNEGQLHYYRVYSYPIFSPSGAMTHVLVMRRDITARTVRERRQQQQEKLAMLGELSAYLAHEIRNPLFSIAGFTNSLLKADDMSDKHKEKLSIVAEETKRLEDMLGSILSFAKPETTELACVDIQRVVGDTVELMRLGHCAQGMDIQYYPEKGLPQVKAEPEGLKQCVVNIIKNAIEAMPEGGLVTVTLGLEHDEAFIRVEDIGEGMDEETLEKVFSPFYSTKAKGYGLGLAVIRKKMEEMNGRVELRSVKGEGTTVTLYLSALCAGSEEGPPQAVPEGSGADTPDPAPKEA